MFGYRGRLLRVDLSQGQLREEPLRSEWLGEYVGGLGYGLRLLWEELDFAAHPLAPENRVVFMAGPLTGTAFPATSRYEVCTRSPLTGLWLDAGSSGYWAADLKRAGYDGLVLEGTAPKPVYLLVREGRAELRDASSLWGRDALETQGLLRRELGEPRLRVAAIGPAGERQVLLSCLINDAGKAAGRGGIGAVLGAKRVKAIAVRGRGRVPVARGARLKERALGLAAQGHPSWAALRRWGTASLMDVAWVAREVPVKNWQGAPWQEGFLRLGGKRLAELAAENFRGCAGCPINCSRWVRWQQGELLKEGPGPEFQSLASLGPLLMNQDLEAVLAAHDLCNRYGLDSISTGSAIAFAMEARERGLLASDGLDLAWGRAEAILELVRQIGEKRGLGELLGQGVRRAAHTLGGGSEEFAVQVKGLEVPMSDPRSLRLQGVNYATGARGPDHMRGNVKAPGLRTLSREDRGQAAKLAQDRSAVLNCLILCSFAAEDMALDELAELLEAATGAAWTGEELLKAGERISNLQRLFNLRCGLRPEDDRLPRRLLGEAEDFEAQLREYYQARGWTPTGEPSPEKLRELGLENLKGDSVPLQDFPPGNG